MPIPIRHYFHCYAINHWELLVREHLNNLLSYGLYDAMESMEIGFIGSAENMNKLKKIIEPYNKICIRTYTEDAKNYEYLTLDLIEKRSAEEKTPFYIYYGHSKGVSYGTSHHAYIGGKTWFDYMTFFNCRKWRDAVYVLDFGYDTYGVKLIPKRVSPSETTHYSGTSFWCKSDYAKTWGKIKDLDTNNRFGAETLLCGQNSPIMFTACQLFVDYICSTSFEDLLKGGHVKEFRMPIHEEEKREENKEEKIIIKLG